jgi:hypothetical protein
LNLSDSIHRGSASPDERWDVCSELYTALHSGELSYVDLVPYAESLAMFCRDVDEQVRPFQKPEGNSWRWAEDYQDPRNEASLLLDILAYAPGDAVWTELYRALTLSDPLLVMAAALALLRHRKPVDPEAIAFVAASDETRSRWEESLKRMDLGYLFPEEFADPESRARGRLVEWLIHPTEWECAPDDVELISEVGDVYVYQFHTRPGYHWSSEEGWLAGIGTVEAGFSDFQPAVLFDADEHARRMLNLMQA